MNVRSTRRTRSRAGLVAVLPAVPLVAGVTTATSAQAATGCRVTYAVSAQWPGGFTADVRVTDVGDPITGWSLGWTFAAGQRAPSMALSLSA